VYTFHAMSTSCVPSFIFFFKISKYIFYDFTGEGTTQPWGKREKQTYGGMTALSIVLIKKIFLLEI
jgi:hypothetical protein